MKRYKHLLAILLCITLVLSMTACVKKEAHPPTEVIPDTTESSEDLVSDNTTPTTNPNDETEPIVIEPPEMDYKMVGLHKSEVGKYGGYLWVVIEMKTLGWFLDMESVVVTDVRNNVELHVDAIYPGRVCANNHRADYYGSTNGHVNDYQQYTLQMYITDETINFEHLKITGDVSWMSPEYQSTEHIPYDFKFNGSIDDITTHQPYIHGYTLFEVDKSYYIFEHQSGSYEDDDVGVYRTIEVFLINGNIDTLRKTFSKNYEFVYSTHRYQDKYLQTAEYNSQWETVLKTDNVFNHDNMLYFGFKYNSINNEEMESLIKNLSFKTQLKDGSWTYFIFSTD